MAAKPLPCPTMLRLQIDCNEKSGELRWKARPRWMFVDQRSFVVWNLRYAGTVALATLNANGYRRGVLRGVSEYAHRAVWAITHGAWPSQFIDHIDGDKLNNAPSNLRDVSHHENMRNIRRTIQTKTGVTGVHVLKSGNYHACAQMEGKHISFGTFESIQEAETARVHGMSDLGFSPQHGTRRNAHSNGS